MYYAINQEYKDIVQGLSEQDPTANSLFLYLVTYMNKKNEFSAKISEIAFDIFGAKRKGKLKECEKYLNKAMDILIENQLATIDESYDGILFFHINPNVVTFVGYPFTMMKIGETNFVSEPIRNETLDEQGDAPYEGYNDLPVNSFDTSFDPFGSSDSYTGSDYDDNHGEPDMLMDPLLDT